MEKGVYRFRELVTQRVCFQVPRYQRYYSWDEKQWEDLWNDLYYLEPDKVHYFGTVILKDKGTQEKISGLWFEEFEIVDGQQRIATIFILLREIITQLEEIGGVPEETINMLKEDYLRFKSVYKLELLGDDREFFKRYIIDGEEYLGEPQTPSQKRLMKAKRFFREKFEEVKACLPERFRDFLLQLIRKIETMEIMVYPIKETAEAARIFELVNDRGKILTNLEKTKSYLMYMIYLTAPPEEQERYLEVLNDRFGKIFREVMEIQNSKYGRSVGEDDIQRYHFIIYATKDVLSSYSSRDVASHEYMRVLRDYIMQKYRTNKGECLSIVLDYAKDLENAFLVLREILTYDKDDELRDLLERILLLGRTANFYPLLIACWIRFKEDNEKIKEILRLIENMSFRVYAIGRRRADTGRNRLYDLAHEVHRGLMDYGELLDELKSLIRKYEWDDLFERHLRGDDFYIRVSGNDIKYLLYEYESYLRKLEGERLEFTLSEILSRDSWGKPNYEVDHIWPRDPSMLGLNEEELKEHEKYVNRLGNLTLVAKGWNRSMGNKPFSEKRKKYRESLLRVQKELALYDEWGKEQIEERENKLVRFALERWKI